MNENLNLVEILKDCPKGTKLYSTVFGEVEIIGIYSDAAYEIKFRAEDGTLSSVTSNGRYYNNFDGECTLFPSREQRDWSKFNLNKEDFVSSCKFKDGDIVATILGSQVFILKREQSNNIGYCYVGYDFKSNTFFPAGIWAFDRLATEGEKRKFFDTIKLKGYKWNAKTKTLEELVKPKFKVGDKIINIPRKYMGAPEAPGIISKITDNKYLFTDGRSIFISSQDSWKLAPDRFDPKTLKPFDKVLARLNKQGTWCCELLSFIKGDTNLVKCCGAYYQYCIPYNEDTRHLVGTTEEAPEYYRYWED